MAQISLGEVTKPSANAGTKYPAVWDDNTKKVYVGRELAGTASSKSDALHVADYYTSTGNTKSM